MESQSYFQRAVNRINSLPPVEAHPMENPQQLYWTYSPSHAFRMAKRIGQECGLSMTERSNTPGHLYLPTLSELHKWAEQIWHPQIVISYSVGTYTVWYLRPETYYQTYNSRTTKSGKFQVGWLYWYGKDGERYGPLGYPFDTPSKYIKPETYRYPRVVGPDAIAIGPHLTAICDCGEEIVVSNYQGDDLDRIFDGHRVGAVCIAESAIQTKSPRDTTFVGSFRTVSA